jgi:PhzF family phenazine biosynthesis protein
MTQTQKMGLPLYQVDAFTRTVFAGNPAGVVPLDSWLPDDRMQAIAAENNLAETAFFVASATKADEWELRWFTPTVEVPLCGHATLASAYVISERLAPGRTHMRFMTKSGALEVTREADRLVMDFPARASESIAPPPGLVAGLGRTPRDVLQSGQMLLCVYDDASDVAALAPDMATLVTVPCFGVIATAPGKGAPPGPDCDFVSRFFAPRQGIPEDPVTGGAHCTLIPYWAKRLGKPKLFARQISARGGEITCEDKGARVLMSGNAVLYLEGTITV